MRRPLFGVVVTVDVTVDASKLSEYADGGPAAANFGPLSGQVISACRESIRAAVMASSPRLVEAYLHCEILTTSAGLAGTYASIGSRQGYVAKEDMREGSDIFLILAYLPLADSFGFVDELREAQLGDIVRHPLVLALVLQRQGTHTLCPRPRRRGRSTGRCRS